MPEGLMGYGDVMDPPAKTLARDARCYEARVQAQPWNVSFADFRQRRIVTAAEESPWEKKIRAEHLQIDDGWGFWPAEEICYGQHLKPGPQNIGNCVGYSHCLLLASKHAHEILCEGDLEEPFGHYSRITPVPYIPYSYGIGRVYVGNGRLRGDGSLCSWQIAATMEYGFLPSDTPGLPTPIPQGSSSTGRNFGTSKRTLEQWRPKAAAYDLLDSLKVENVDQAKEVVTIAKTPLQICSGWGFGRPRHDSTRDLWISQRSGSWAHSMQIVGVIEIKGEWFAVVRNQWGENYHKEPGRGIPKGCFVIGIDTFARWIRDAYVSTIGELQARNSWSDWDTPRRSQTEDGK